MTRFVARPGLDGIIARTVGQRAVDRLKNDTLDGARRRAPEAKIWVTERDERVRPSHVSADRQTIPGNLRYKLPKMTYIRKGRDARGKAINPAGGWKEIDGYDLGRQPRDPDLPPEQRDQCRCHSVDLPGVMARNIFMTDTLVAGSRARADVETYFNRAAESEFGTSEDVPARFMAGGAREAMVRLQGRSPRR
jgi:hypothetical protein